MDDFLHNLRKNTERQYDRRKQYNNPQYRGPDRRGPRDQQRRPYQKRNEAQELITATVPEIKELLQKIESGQQKMIDEAVRRADAQERQADVLETIAEVLQRLADADTALPKISGPLTYEPEAEIVQEEQSEALVSAPAYMERDDVVDMITQLRDDGMTYKEIAQKLEDDNIRTFSGKGAWHAQTVHKVCKRGV